MADLFNPVNSVWYLQPDDLIGGWCAMNVDKPPSQADPDKGEGTVAECITEETARHIVDIHNTWLREYPPVLGTEV